MIIIILTFQEAVENTARRGFVNYFGHQRFGYEEGVATRACAVGLAMLQGNFMKAVKLLLMHDLNKNDEGNTAKRYNIITTLLFCLLFFFLRLLCSSRRSASVLVSNSCVISLCNYVMTGRNHGHSLRHK